MKFINFKALSKRKKITLVALSVLFVASIVAFLLKHNKPQTNTPTFSSFLKHSTSRNIRSPLPATVPVAATEKKNKLAVQKPVISKKQGNKLNDLFKLKQKKKSVAKAAHPYPMKATFPAGQGYPNAGYPNINNIPNAIKNMQLPSIAQVPNRQEFKVLGISGRNAVIQYQGGDLYLKSGEAFGSCFVIEISYSSVKISCNKIARSYPVSFSANGNTNSNTTNGNIKINPINPVK